MHKSGRTLPLYSTVVPYEYSKSLLIVKKASCIQRVPSSLLGPASDKLGRNLANFTERSENKVENYVELYDQYNDIGYVDNILSTEIIHQWEFQFRLACGPSVNYVIVRIWHGGVRSKVRVKGGGGGGITEEVT